MTQTFGKLSMRAERRSRSRSLWVFGGGVLLALSVALPAWAAQVVDVRVGQHNGYSRVVFELDAPAGYKVERSSPDAGKNQLVISLDAIAEAQTLRGKLTFIESVAIQPSGRGSTVHIQLKGEGLRLKEMILANPPRIVLDVLADSPPRTAPVVSAAVEPDPEPEPEAADPAPAPVEEETYADVARESEPPASIEGVPGSGSSASPQRFAMAQTGAPPSPPKAATARPAAIPAAVPAAMPKPAPAAIVAPTATSTQDGGFSVTNITLGALAFVFLAGAGAVFMRRRSRAEEVDPSVFDEAMSEDNPFAAQTSEAPGDESADEIGAAEIVDADSEASSEVEAETVFDAQVTQELDTEPGNEGIEIPAPTEIMDAPIVADGATEGETAMELDNSTTTIMDAPQAPPMGMPAAGGEDVARMIAEFERRMAGMETRIDELVDAKERLERQVAAQTEELRVQRAAIARTQRAVRNLNRPGEDAPTEPALRDPSRPEGPRG